MHNSTVYKQSLASVLLEMDPTVCPTIITSTTTTLSCRIGKVVASHAAVARSSPAEVGLIYTMRVAVRGTAHEGRGCDQSIGSTVSDAMVRSWL